MENICQVDKSFKVETSIDEKGLLFFDAEEEPFKIYGVFHEGDRFRRMPENIAKSVSEGVHYLHSNTAGGRVKFITDSPYVAISVVLDKAWAMNHFAYTGVAGFDLYEKTDDGEKYRGTFRPPTANESKGYESIIRLDGQKQREFTINMPLYTDVKKIYIGLKEGSKISAPGEYKNEKPVVYYGSSITQGACASRPGMSYEGIIQRALDIDYINLGFSGSAKGEKEIAEYISELDMSLLVMDYDYNAPTPEHLEKTHEPLFKAVREKNPDLPVLMISHLDIFPAIGEEGKKRLEIIERTYKNAVQAGDKNVYFIDGATLFSDEIRSDATVDGCHPTDLGFFSMAKKMIPVIKDILF